MSGKKQQRRQATSERLATYRPDGEPEKRGTAEVRASKDEQGRLVSVWRFPPDALPSSRTRRTFKLLLEQARGLVHPAVLTLHDGGTDDGEGRPYLVMERVAAGETARQALGRGPLPWEDGLIVARDLLQGLAAGHARGLVHGALSPDELYLVRTPGQPRGKLQPFGFTRLLGPERDTPWGGTRVDPEWAAPEVVKGEPVDTTADVYSAALLIHALLAGQHPVPAPLKDGLRARILDEPSELPRGIIPDQALGTALRQSLRRALTKDPSRRCGSVGELEKALDPGAGAPLPPSALLPDGGPCAGCAARIPPLATRTWDRHASDRPFKCSGCQQVFCGKVHWDARGFCCKRCADRQIAEYASASDIALPESSSDIALVPRATEPAPAATPPVGAAPRSSPPTPATPSASGSLAAERKRALLELAQVARDAERPSAESQRLAAAAAAESQRLADKAAASESQRLKAQQAPPPPTGPTPLATTSRAATEDAVLQAWADENRTRETARSRLAESNTSKIEKPEPKPVAPAARPEPAVAVSQSPGLELLAGVALGFVVLFVGAAWLGDRNARKEQALAREEKHRQQIGELERIADEGAAAVGALTQKQLASAREASERTSERDAARKELEGFRAEAAGAAGQWEQERKQLLARSEALSAEARASGQKALAAEEERGRLQTDRDALARMNQDLLAGTVPIPAVEKRISELDRQLKQLTEERNGLAGAANDLRARATALETAARNAEELRLAAATRVAELEGKLAAIPAPAPAAAPGEASRVALALLPFGAAPAPGPVTIGATGPWPARGVLRVPLAQAVPVLQQALQGEAVVAVALRLDGERRRLRLSGAALAANAAPDPLRPGRSAAAATQAAPDGLLRFWISGPLAAAWLAEADKPGAAELVFLLEPVPGEVGEAKVAEAWLTATPLGAEAALRLRELERR